MTEDELNQLMKAVEEHELRVKNQPDSVKKELIPCLIKVPIEGFLCYEESVFISEDLSIQKFDPASRAEFFERVSSLELGKYSEQNNWFYFECYYNEERQNISGPEAGVQLLLLAMFVALGSDSVLRLNKAHRFLKIKDSYQSAGIFYIPIAPWSYDEKVNFDEDMINQLRSFWPLYNRAIDSQPHFAFTARRYYYSLTRHEWEDQLIDLIITLESLLIPEENGKNKAGKLATRLSRLLSKNHKRGEITDIVKYAYKLRNVIVHGKYHPDVHGIHYGHVKILRVIVKEALRSYVENYNHLNQQEFAKYLDNMSGDQI